MKEYQPLIIAHRGASKEAFENSFESFKLAIEQKADMIELDTHLTSDGYFIVHHDADIKYKNRSYVISKTPLKTIEALKLPNGENIPLLDNVLKRFLPLIKFNIEIKCTVKKSEFDELLASIEYEGNKIIVSSFLRETLSEIQDSKYKIPLAFLYFFPGPNATKMFKVAHISAMNPYHKLLSMKSVKKYHMAGKKIYPWTVNNYKDIEKLVRKSVDGIITDTPKKTREIVEKCLAIFKK